VEIISRVILLKSIQAVSKGEAKPKVAIANRQDLRGGRRDSKRLAPAKPECGEEERKKFPVRELGASWSERQEEEEMEAEKGGRGWREMVNMCALNDRQRRQR